jgi:hypothetical protein
MPVFDAIGAFGDRVIRRPPEPGGPRRSVGRSIGRLMAQNNGQPRWVNAVEAVMLPRCGDPSTIWVGLRGASSRNRAEMSAYVGVDVHRQQSQVAVVDEVGEVTPRSCTCAPSRMPRW